jgi:AraC-like DNA-binding protein
MVKNNDLEIAGIKLPGELFRSFLNDNPRAPLTCNIAKRKVLRSNVQNVSLSYFTFTCVLQGSGNIILDPKRAIKCELKPGTAFLRFPDSPFSIWRSNDYVEFTIILPPSYGLLFEKHCRTSINILNLELTEHLLLSFQHCLQSIRSATAKELFYYANKLFLFISEIFSLEKSQKSIMDNSFIEQSCALLHESLDSKVSGREIAKKMTMGYESFRKKFTAAMKISPNQYVMNLKFEKAVEMIFADYSLKEIAFTLGYSDIATFSRQFKKNYGMGPAEFKLNSKFEYL